MGDIIYLLPRTALFQYSHKWVTFICCIGLHFFNVNVNMKELKSGYGALGFIVVGP